MIHGMNKMKFTFDGNISHWSWSSGHSHNVQLLTQKHADKKQKTFMRIDEIIHILIQPLASINWL